MSQKAVPSEFGNIVTLILVIVIEIGVICVEQLVPEYPIGQSQPQSALETPPFWQTIGVHGGVELESEEQPKNAVMTINVKIDFKTYFFIISVWFSCPKEFRVRDKPKAWDKLNILH